MDDDLQRGAKARVGDTVEVVVRPDRG
jgi:hypothetical protein